MLKISIKLENGTVCVDNKALNLQSAEDFKSDLTLAAKEQLNFLEHNNYQKYYIDGKFLDKEFRLSITFFEEKIYYSQILLSPAWGNAFTKGYETSYDEVIKDIQSLAKILETEQSLIPSLRDFNRVLYRFEWGEIVCSGSLKTPSAGISIKYK